jgi:hypothetical protein
MYFSVSYKGTHVVIDEAFEMETGEIRKIDTDTAIYIAKKLELEDKPYSDVANEMFFDLYENAAYEVYQNYLTSFIDEIIVDDNIKQKYKFFEI